MCPSVSTEFIIEFLVLSLVLGIRIYGVYIALLDPYKFWPLKILENSNLHMQSGKDKFIKL